MVSIFIAFYITTTKRRTNNNNVIDNCEVSTDEDDENFSGNFEINRKNNSNNKLNFINIIAQSNDDNNDNTTKESMSNQEKIPAC